MSATAPSPSQIAEPFRPPSNEELLALFYQKYSSSRGLGWGPQLRLDYGYFNPDDYYEALVDRLVTSETSWLDIGCGRDIFPFNRTLAAELSARAALIQGVDPDPNIHDNPFLSEAFHGRMEDFSTEKRFDLVTLRMVAEHIANPDEVLRAIKGLMKPAGLVLIYTPSKWSPVSILARAIPFRCHHLFKRWLWHSESRDTFPVTFLMNTRSTLRRRFEAVQMQERLFLRLADCTVFARFYWLNRLELAVSKTLNSLNVRYPESCILAVFQNQS